MEDNDQGKNLESDKLPGAKAIRFGDSLFLRQVKLVVVAAFIIGLILSLIQIATDIRRERVEIDRTVNEVVGALKGPATQAAYALNSDLAERVLEGLFEYRPIYRAQIINDFNETLAIADRAKSDAKYGILTYLLIGEAKDYAIDLYIQGSKKSVGKINVSVDGSLVAAGFVERLALVFLSGVVRIILLSLAIAGIFYWTLSRPLLLVIANIYDQRKKQVRFDAPEKHKNDEIGLLFEAFNVLLMDREEANKALQESNDLFVSLTAAMPDTILLMDETGKIHGEFGWGRAMIHEGTEDLSISYLSDRFSEKETSMFLNFIQQTIADKTMKNLDFSIPVGDQIRWFEGRTIPLAFKRGGSALVLVVARDITEQKDAERLILRAKEEAEYANNVKTQFLANMSHELRTPLNAIIGFADIMRMEQFGKLGSPKYNEYSRDISLSGQHLLSVITEILDVSKIEAGRLDLNDDRVDIASLVESCLRLVNDRAQSSGVKLRSELSKTLPYLQADELRLKQILINLLSNSVKFTPKGGLIKIEAVLEMSGQITLKVSDTGIGIPKEKLGTVLEPFGQAEDIMTRNNEGTGLGLFLAKSFSELHDAEFRLESAVDRGTVVTIRFPVDRVISKTTPDRLEA